MEQNIEFSKIGNIIIPFSLIERFLLVYNDQGLKFDIYEIDIKISRFGLPLDDYTVIRKTDDHYVIAMSDGWPDNNVGRQIWQHYTNLKSRAEKGFFLKNLDPVNPGNPYIGDIIRMGQELIDGIEFMRDHIEEHRREGILVNKKTGDRIKLFFPIK